MTFKLGGTVSRTALRDLVNTATAVVPAGFEDIDLSNNEATDRDVMWKEWLANPPNPKRLRVDSTPPPDVHSGTRDTTRDTTADEQFAPPVLAFTGSNAARTAGFAVLLLTLGAGLIVIAGPVVAAAAPHRDSFAA